MTGYRIFYRLFDNRFPDQHTATVGPYHKHPSKWKKPARGVTIRSYLNTDYMASCGAGISFFPKLRDLRDWMACHTYPDRPCSYISPLWTHCTMEVWEVYVMGHVTAPSHAGGKARTDKLTYVRPLWISHITEIRA